jgi:hypothetical protein
VPLAVSLTMPLGTYLGLVDDPGQLDGYGPIPAALARRLAVDAAREQPTTTWRCVIVDDVHRTVLGVGRPIRTPHHDPPPRLAQLVRAAEPTCCFPGCRIPARRCDLDHRRPYQPAHPDGDPAGGGATCSCNLQPLCRGHHRLKTLGLVRVRVIGPADDPRAAPGTLEWTSHTGLTYRRPPTPTTGPASPADPAGPVDPAADPELAAALTHAATRDAQDAADQASIDNQPEYQAWRRQWHAQDHADQTWRASLHKHQHATADAARRHTETTRHAAEPPPF